MAELHRVTIDGVEYDLPSGGGGIDPSVIADEWDPNTEYWKNEFCFHNDILWCAVRETNEEPSEDSDDWNNVPLASIVGGIQDNFEYLYAAINEELMPCTISQMAITGLDGGSMELYIWDESVRYDQGDIVLLMSTINDSQVMESVWRCLKSNTNVRPEKGEYWEYESALKTIHDIGGVRLGKDENGNSGYYNNDGTLTIFAKKDAITSDTWDPSKTYTIGQYCIDDNTLWRCLIQNENTKPTEGTYWTRETIGNNLVTTDGEGNRGYLKADGSFSPFKSGIQTGMPIEFVEGRGMDFSVYITNGNKGGNLFKFTTDAKIHFTGGAYMYDYCNMWLDHKRNGNVIQNLLTMTGSGNKYRFKWINFDCTIDVLENDTISFTSSASSTLDSSAKLNQFRIYTLEVV